MGGLEQDLHILEASEEDDCWSRTFDEKVCIVDDCFKKNFTRDQSIANLEKQIMMLNKRLADEMSLMRQELAEWFGNMKKPDKQRRNDVREVPDNSVCKFVFKPSVEKTAITSNGPVEGIDIENGDVATLKVDTDSFVAHLERANKKTVADYEQKLKNKDQVVASLEDMVKALEATVAEKTENSFQLREQITKKDSEISKLTMCINGVEAKDQEVSNLKSLLEQANKKLENRFQQMKLTETRLTQLITDMKVNDVKQTEDIRDVAKQMKTVVHSLTGIRDHIYHIHGIRKVNGADNSVCPTRLHQLYRPMIEKLSAKPVAARLFQDDVFSLTELEKVQCSDTPAEAAEYLLNQLLSKCSDVSYNSFLTALEATNQGHILLWLTCDDFNINSQHTNVIRQKYTFLLEQLNPQHSGLIAVLFENKVIDQEEKEILLSGGSANRQVERLLSMLSRKSVEQFKQFLVALDVTGQSHVAEELRRCHQSDETSAAVRREVVSSRTTTNTVMHVLTASEDRKGSVNGLAVHGYDLFIVRSLPRGLIEVYNVETCTFKRNIKVKELDERCVVNGLTSCDNNSCLYVGYWGFGYAYIGDGWHIAKVELTGDNKVVKWKVKDDCYEPQGLSVNREHNLLVACYGSRNLIEYTTRGELVREILLQDDVIWPRHAIQLNSNRYLVSRGYGDSLHRLCVVDDKGRVLLTYENKPGSETGQLRETRQLAVDRNGFIYVADHDNNRIVVLNSRLNWSRDLHFDGGSGVVKHPNSLYLDEQRHLLFVGESGGDDSRVIVVKV